MPQVNADPEKLRQFAKSLTVSAQQFEQLARNLRRSLEATGWNDSERQRFEADFQQTLKSLSQFTERLRGEYVPALQRKAEALDRFNT